MLIACGLLSIAFSLQGNSVICKRKEGDKETYINLELLFNAAIQGKLK